MKDPAERQLMAALHAKLPAPVSIPAAPVTNLDLTPTAAKQELELMLGQLLRAGAGRLRDHERPSEYLARFLRR